VRAHQKVDPFATPGEADLTALVDFSALVPVAQQAGARVEGIVPQGPFLQRLGIEARAQGLARSAPDHAQTIARALARLVAPEEMGNLFKAMAVSAPTGQQRRASKRFPDPAPAPSGCIEKAQKPRNFPDKMPVGKAV
jgi:NADH dehydrogenase [ubiquinone] 1 alpha subcomplex assembly factor 7